MRIILKTSILTWFATIVLLSCAISQKELKPMKIAEKSKPQYIIMADEDVAKIAHRIGLNEGIAKVEKLTVWKQGESFASFGIGHFIWHPIGAAEQQYEENFPILLEFLQQQRILLPEWLQTQSDCPWNTREEFYDNINSIKMNSLRNLLKNTITQQVLFLIKYLEKNLPEIITALPTKAQRIHVRKQFSRLTQESRGIYALVDYANFKGKGINPKEPYKGEGCGLLQVLENMSGNSKNMMTEFVQSANQVLMRCIHNVSPEYDKFHRLPLWQNRVNTYLYEW